MRTPLVAGNWKLNKNTAEARQLISEMLPELQKIETVESLLCPPFMALPAAAELLKGTDIGLGGQNMYWEASGAYTGETSPTMLAEFCQYVILGHSERRAYFGETDETVNRKTLAAMNYGLKPVVCVGETLDENEAGKTAEVVTRQVTQGLQNLSLASGLELVVAYEPVWAIGTGKAAMPEDASRVTGKVIRPALAEMFGAEIAQAIRILYGGSVKPGNATEYFSLEDVDGALVGGASLKAADFIAITQAAA